MTWLHSGSALKDVNVGFSDSPAVDAFSRLRVSNPATLFDTQLQYDTALAFWYSDLTGNGTVTHDPNNSAVNLNVTTSSGDKVIRQTRQYFRYQPGKSQQIILTGVIGRGQSNVKQTIGYGDAENGIFFECADAVMGVVLRSKVSGAVVDSRIAQANWNLDTMDGSGPSGVNIDWEKSQVFFIDLEWLSVGRVRLGLFLDGIPKNIHQFLNANTIGGAYMTTANLPIRYEIENTGAAALSSTLKQICSVVNSEGGFTSEFGLPAHIGNTTLINVNTDRPILSIRPKATFNNIVNRANILVESLGIFSEDNDAHYTLVYGGTLTNDSWNDVNADFSAFEFDVAADAIAGGLIIGGSFAVAGGQGAQQIGGENIVSILSQLPLALDIDGNHPTVASHSLSDNLTLTASTIAGAAGDVLGQFTWRELK